MIHIVLPIALIASIKLFFLTHGLSISMDALQAGYRAHRNGQDVVEAAIAAGASRAAAILLGNALKKYC
jgi:hypothetical protein